MACGLCARIGTNATDGPAQHSPDCFDKFLARFLRRLHVASVSYYVRTYPNIKPEQHEEFVAEVGKRNVRIVKRHPGDKYGSAFCFVEVGSGKIMKAAGAKAPDPKRYERGNIFRSNPLEGIGPHGPQYRRGGGGYEFDAADLYHAEASDVAGEDEIIRALTTLA